jgi:hypothetical protein
MSEEETGSGRDRIANWVKVVGAVCAVLTLGLGVYKVSLGSESLDSKLREAAMRDRLALCTEAVGVMAALATSVHDEQLAPQLKVNFLTLRNGRIKLLEQPAIDSIIEVAYRRYQEEDQSRGDFAPGLPEATHIAAYRALSANLGQDARELAAECNLIEP